MIDDLAKDIKTFVDEYDWSKLPNGEKYRQIQGHFMRGEDNPMADPEIREIHKLKMQSKEVREKISKSLLGHKKSNTENYFKPKSKTHAENISKAASKRERTICSKCGQGYTKANFKRHYDSCRGVKQALYKKCDDGIVRRII